MDPFVLLLHGLSGSGKTTIGKCLYKDLSKKINVIHIDGDDFRQGLSSGLGYSLEDRYENIRRLMELCKMLLNNNISVIASFMAPTESIRNILRDNIIELIEVWCSCSLKNCVDRDVKGLYNENVPNLSGVDQVFELPRKHLIELDISKTNLRDCDYIIKTYLFHVRLMKKY